MDQYLLFAIIGLGSGCLYAALSMGLVITYRGTGIINFATGAMAMWGAYVYDELSDTGDLVLPLVIIRSRISLGGSSGSVPFGVAIVLAVLSCSLIGLMVHFLVFRPLRRAPILARVVASVGVLLVIQALIVMHFMSSARVVAPILPNEPVSFAGVSFSRDRLWLTAVVLLTAAAAWAWFRFTRMPRRRSARAWGSPRGPLPRMSGRSAWPATRPRCWPARRGCCRAPSSASC